MKFRKRGIPNRMNNRKNIFITAFAILTALLLSFAVYKSGALTKLFGGKPSNAAPVETLEVQQPESAHFTADCLRVHFIDVGQGDCTLITCGKEAMLIDAGDNSHGTAVWDYLQKQGIQNLKYVIGTHPDADHIGGLDVVITKFECGAVMMPDYEADTPTYRDVIDAVKYKGYSVIHPKTGSVYELGGSFFTVLGPVRKYDDSNNNSIVIKLEYGNDSFLFTGDCGKDAEADIVSEGFNIRAEVYKVGHHGSAASCTKEFLEKIRPEYAVISCGAGNEYGHPHDAVLTKLNEAEAMIFRTDENGTVIATSDGNGIEWETKRR